MKLTITCFTPAEAREMGAVFNDWLPAMCCAEGCAKHAVYKLTGRAPPKGRRQPKNKDWLCFEIGLTLCEDHERSRLPVALVELPEVRRRIKGIARDVCGAQVDMNAVEVTMIPFALGHA